MNVREYPLPMTLLAVLRQAHSYITTVGKQNRDYSGAFGPPDLHSDSIYNTFSAVYNLFFRFGEG